MDGLDWLIVGGGPHGTHLAAALLAQGAHPRRVRVLDPEERPLARWWRRVDNVGMRFLRSPVVHHLDVDPWSLKSFARAEGFGADHFAPPYDRPSVALFRAHCDMVERRHGLAALRLVGRAERIWLCPGHVEVQTARGALRADRVLLTLGSPEQLRLPGWTASVLARAPRAQIHHVLAPDFSLEQVPSSARVLVVGGGITAAQVATCLGARGHPVVLASPHAPRIHTFDSDPGWLGPRYMRSFLGQRDPALRRRAITAARHRGSMPQDVYQALRRAVRAGRVDHRVGALTDATPLEGGGVAFRLGERAIHADVVLLATGFASVRPGGRLVDRLVEEHDLPVAPGCGFPLVTPDLRWSERLHVAGALAELELGPAARNLVGARRAAERLLRGEAMRRAA